MALCQLSLFDDYAPVVSTPITAPVPPFIYTLSLDQAWASLVALRLKQYETRNWKTKYRGLIAIHATVKGFKIADYEGRHRSDFTDHLWRLYDERLFNFWGLPTRCILAVADLVDIMPVQDIRDQLTPQELAFGNYSTDIEQRYAWKLENVRAFPQPIERSGRQRLWHWTVTPDEWALIEALRQL